jgi:homoaconitase/3-isopropylmalate dehydratase large subunit
MNPQTMFDKIWDTHVVEALPDGTTVLHVDRHLLHELTAVEAIRVLEGRGLTVRDASLTFATPDHVISSVPGVAHASPALQPWHHTHKDCVTHHQVMEDGGTRVSRR